MRKLVKAAERVLALRDGQHSIRDEIDAYQRLSAAVEGAKDELRAAARAGRAQKTAKKA